MKNSNRISKKINGYLKYIKSPLPELLVKADQIRRIHCGKTLDICSIINAKSGRCSEDCKYCAQSGHHSTSVAVYPLLSSQELFEAASKARADGALRFGIVTSGNRLSEAELNQLTAVIKKIIREAGISVCGSLGALTREELLRLKESGMTRYHHNIETSASFYPKIVSTHSFEDRLKTIAAAKSAGMEVCSGGIIGLGESWEDRIEMALILKELKVDSVPVNILIPFKGTPLFGIPLISREDVIRTLCIFRIILKDKIIRIAAGRETRLKDFQGLGFMAGANGMLIGGYLTTRGRSVEEDQDFIQEIRNLWAHA